MAILPLEMLEFDKEQESDLQSGQLVLTGDVRMRIAYMRIPGGDEVLEVLLLGPITTRYQWSWLLDPAIQGTPIEPGAISPINRIRARYRPVQTTVDGTAHVVIADSNGTLRAVPSSLPSSEPRIVGVLVQLSLTAIMLFLVLLPVRRNLRRLGEATKRLAAGDLSARVGLRGRHEIARLGQLFDRMADELSSLMRNKEELLRAVAHELRIPISRVFYATDLVRSSADPDERAELLYDIDSAMRELKELTEELLTYARLDATHELQSERLLARDVVDTVLATRPYTRVELIRASQESVWIEADERLLIRALSNLLSNAVRAAHRRVVLTVEQSDADIYLHVDDDGRGVAPEHRERIFWPFIRVEESRGRDLGGSGLGLSIVRRIAERHGGLVTVGDSELGGARFTLALPATRRLS